VSNSGETAIESSLGGLTDIRARWTRSRTRSPSSPSAPSRFRGIHADGEGPGRPVEHARAERRHRGGALGRARKGFAVVARENPQPPGSIHPGDQPGREILEDISGRSGGRWRSPRRNAEDRRRHVQQVALSGENLKQLSNIVKDQLGGPCGRSRRRSPSRTPASRRSSARSRPDEDDGRDDAAPGYHHRGGSVPEDLSQRVSDVVRASGVVHRVFGRR